tara:strand:+ start:4279 stop:6072 length:1794 start_codon:yes stop_codon:yes gene_type:complete
MIISNNKFFDLKLFKKIMIFVHPYRVTYYLLILSAVLLSIFSTIQPYLLKIIIDDYIIKSDLAGLKVIIYLVILILLLEVLFQFLFIYFANWLGQTIVKDIRYNLFNKIINFKMSYYDKNPIGRLVTRTASDIELISSIFSQGLFMILADLLKMSLVIIIMLVIDWQLSLIVFSVLPIIVYATKLFQRSMKVAFEDVRNQVSILNSFVQERINGMTLVQLFNREKIDKKRFKKINEKHKNAWLKTVWYNSIFFPVAEISTSITIGLLVWFGGISAGLYGTISIGTIFLFIKMSQMLFQPLRQIADKFNTLQMGMVAAERVFEIIDMKNKEITNGNELIKNIKGLIEIKNLIFSYTEEKKYNNVIDDLSLKINPGEKIAIVGHTGSGKSTIINLLTRFYEYDHGEIYIDGISIKKIKISEIRKNISVVLQDVFLFADTIYNNIVLFDEKKSLNQVIKLSKEIGAHDFINLLPNKYFFNVKERGASLSSGQRQLISFLRAYISNPSILILDEATSSIDSYTEELIQNAIQKITSGKTSIIIAHRLATIKKADKIIVIDNGRIVEFGNHNTLLSKRGIYKDLHDSQLKKEKNKIKERDLF